MENQTRVPKFVFENNAVTYCPHLRISDNGAHVIRNNVFNGIRCILVLDLLRYWYESGAVADMLIEENTFKGSPRYGEGYAITIHGTRNEQSGVRHKNIRINGNHFLSPNTHAIYATDVDGLTIHGNRFEGGSEETMLNISKCSDVMLQENVFLPVKS